MPPDELLSPLTKLCRQLYDLPPTPSQVAARAAEEFGTRCQGVHLSVLGHSFRNRHRYDADVFFLAWLHHVSCANGNRWLCFAPPPPKPNRTLRRLGEPGVLP